MIDTNTDVKNETPLPSRPNRHAPAVRQAAAEKMWPAFRAWLIANDATETEADEDRETAQRELADALEWNEDGYDVAQYLERQGWDADDGLVDAARRLVDALYVAHDEAVKAWAVATEQRPTFKLGDRVRFEHHGRQRSVDGEVTKVDAARAKYVVYCASLGHVRDEGTGSHGIYINFEDVRATT